MLWQGARLAVLLSTAIAASACTDAAVTDPPAGRAAAVTVSGSNPTLERTARAFALAMADPQVRADLRDAMRASPLTEHKLVLQEYLSTVAGARLIQAAAIAVGIAPGEIHRLVAQLPEMDLYLPYRNHRLTWRASGDVVFTAVTDVDSPRFEGYRTDGSAVLYRTADGTPEEVLVMIHPAEVKGRRVGAQPATPGEVVQDSDDGEWSGRITWVDHRTGKSRTIELADLVGAQGGMTASLSMTEECDPDTAIVPCDEDHPGTSPKPADTTRLDYFKIFFNDGAGSSEIEYRAEYYNVNAQQVTTATLRIEGVEEDRGYFPRLPLIHDRIREGSNEWIYVKLFETDAFSDDEKGDAYIFADDRNVLLYTSTQPDSDCYPLDMNGDGQTDAWTCADDPESRTSEFMVGWTPKY